MTSQKWASTESTCSHGTVLPSPGGRRPETGLDRQGWRLPTGETLAEFALQSGFLAPRLLEAEGVPESGPSLPANRSTAAKEVR